MVDDDDPAATTPRVAPAGAATAHGVGAAGKAPNVESFLPTLMDTRGDEDGTGGAKVVLPAAGYQMKELIGRGGMGEVVAAHDQRIGRQVALKRMRGAQPSSESLGRFLREARIQARLDHPAIVPVYELGVDAEGNPYFTMKQITGTTLTQQLADSSSTLQASLRALVEVCLAIDFAHARGVVHRDLKPSNIILGGYGEVYVLDWGIARVLASKRVPTSGGGDGIDLVDVETQHGSLLGTPGYMAPEQMRDASGVEQAADVYSLGAILFEILAGEPLHPRGAEALASTASGGLAGPATRRPERAIPPELDIVCSDAIADAPEKRPTARALADRVQRYLDGDRDVERRRELAEEQLAVARAAIASNDPGQRATAIHAAGRALALDAKSVEAAEIVTRLIIEPPRERPPELDAQLARGEAERAKSRAKNGAIAYTLILLLTSAVAFLEVRDWSAMALIWVAILANLVLAVVTMRIGINRTRYVVITSGLMAVAVSRVASPLILVPAIICGSALSVASTQWMAQRVVRPLIWVLVIAMLPFLLEWTGVFPSTMTPQPGQLLITSTVFQTKGMADFPVLLAGNIGFLVIVALFVHGVARDRRRAERIVEMQAWHLRKLLPTQTLAGDKEV